MDTKGLTSDDLMQYMEGHNLRNFDIDPGEIDVGRFNSELCEETEIEYVTLEGPAQHRSD